ncbi:MAG: nucleotide exchange factor GrpE [Clostridia bacterium]|nr:nucleotide exchange factor GrpE [Clostridia bacterium]
MAKVKIEGSGKESEKEIKEEQVEETVKTENDGSVAPEIMEDEIVTEDEVKEEETPEGSSEKDAETDAQNKKSQSFFNKKRQKENSKHEKELEQKVEKLTQDISDEKTRYLRLLADFENYKKRTAKETETRYLDSKADTLKKILPVVDAYERALKTEVPEDAKQYTAGFEMIYDILKKILADNGVEEIKALGEEFDPGLHNAVMHVDDDQAGQNVIVEVFEKGYRMGDRILRYSIVKVAN